MLSSMAFSNNLAETNWFLGYLIGTPQAISELLPETSIVSHSWAATSTSQWPQKQNELANHG